MKDVHVDVCYISMDSNLKNSSPILFNKILYKTVKLTFKIHPKWNFASLKLKFGMLDWDCVRIQ